MLIVVDITCYLLKGFSRNGSVLKQENDRKQNYNAHDYDQELKKCIAGLLFGGLLHNAVVLMFP